MIIYEAGSLFSESQIRYRIFLEERIKEIFNDVDDVKIYNPITAPINDKSKNPTARDIFWGDTNELLKSDVMLYDMDDEFDTGVAMEGGISIGVNIMLDLIKEHLGEDAFFKINKLIPYKKIMATYTDIRQVQTGNGVYNPKGYNQFVVGGIDEFGKIFKSSEEMFDGLQKLYNYNK